MTTKLRNGCFIIDVEADKLTGTALAQLKRRISSLDSDKRIALNLMNVSAVGNDFLEYLSISEKKLSLLNLSLNIYLLLFIMKYDRFADLFVTEFDFLANQRSIVNRKFKLLKAV